MKPRILICIATATLLVFSLPLVAQNQLRYTVTDLGTLGGTFSSGEGINNKGWVSGFSTLQHDIITHALLWREGVITDLGTPGLNSLIAYPFNEHGQVAIHSEILAPDPLGEDFCGFGTQLACPPFVWQGGFLTQLPTLGGENGHTNQINNRGEVAGVAENTTPDPTCRQECVEGGIICPFQVLQTKPVLWKRDHIEELQTLPGDPDGGALVINDNGEVAGTSGQCIASANEALHAVLWKNGAVTDLGNLGGTTNNHPQYINNRGQVVGYSNTKLDITTHAFLWDQGVITDLQTLGGDFASFGDAINDAGLVGGSSCDASFNCRAFLWQNGVMTDVNTLISPGSTLFLVDVLSINSRGEIVGDAFDTSSMEAHGYLATPINDVAAAEGAPLTGQTDAPERRAVRLPENLRQMLRHRLGSGRTWPIAHAIISSQAAPRGAPSTLSPSSPQSLPLNGGSVASRPNATLSPTSMVFECRNVINAGCQCITSRTATLSNSGTAALNISKFTISGPFSEANNCGTSLGAGKSCSINVRWSERNGSGLLSLFDNAGGSPQETSLSGIKFCTPL